MLFIIQNPVIVNRNADFFLQNESIRFESIQIANRNALLWPHVP